MDLDGNREINLDEFLSFMRQQGYYKKMQNCSFFQMLDTSGRGTLAFMDVITFYYIIKSGRPFCDSCHRFIPGTFFSCVKCFNQLRDSFTLCTSCHLNTNKYHHKHDGRSALFLDNFTLLQATKPHLPITTTTNQEAAHTEPPDLSTTETQQPLLLMGKGDSVSTSTSTSTSEKKHVNSEAANSGISITAKTQQPLLLGKGESASTSTSKNGDMNSKSATSVTVTPAKSVAKTSTPSARIKSSHDRNAIVSAIKPAASISTLKNDDLAMYMASEMYRIVREQQQSPPPSQPQSTSPLVNQLPNVNVNKIESTTSTPNTICVRPPNQQVTWMKAASVALKALDAIVAISSIAGAVSACTIM
ncbi:platelet binding protein GspB-like isoform X2 [Salvia splendens]|uniref:platelet binding protein GspB-like isoform X2 n=1 Tax=Salvia splendens TaxID=180675 RepID=UPI001C257ED3|nr:platelet binding protein GspB-like isoform X2 [Salvia splendens]